MLAKLSKFEEQISLIENSGIQFLDFGFCKALKTLPEGNFLTGQVTLDDGNLRKFPILLQSVDGRLLNPARNGAEEKRQPDQSLAGVESLDSFDEQWLPLAFYHQRIDSTFSSGPINWVRGRVKRLPEPDSDGNLFRLTLAVDTNIARSDSATAYLAPTMEDIRHGRVFGMVSGFDQINHFALQSWVSQWVDRAWQSNLRDRNGQSLPKSKVEERIAEWPLEAQAKYLHWVTIAASQICLPRIKLLENNSDKPKVETTLILDLGNSRTCAILLEKHPDQASNLTQSYTLEIRDLHQAHLVYSDPFESRVEFSEADFGSTALSRDSGRSNAFMWPTLTRVGPEAARLAARRRGTEGATGIAGPKRYLWDESAYPLDWRFNQPASLALEPLAIEGVFVTLINASGDALSELADDDPNRLPVINPRYSRSSLMSFAIAEILAHALCQINSASKRLSMPNSDLVRTLNRIIITLPPAMPKQEQQILRRRAESACTLLWQALGHLDENGEVSSPVAIARPTVITQYDEASCAQVVWLYSMIVHHFGGSAPAMFEANKRRYGDAKPIADHTLRVASIDIGGGTTDLVISDYELDGMGTNVTIKPRQIFREGFNIAGDDILKRVIQVHVLGSLEQHLKTQGIADPELVTKNLFGADRGNEDIQIKTLRRQATTQLLAPLGLKLLNLYEKHGMQSRPESYFLNFGEVLTDRPTEGVLNYVNQAMGKAGARDFDVLDAPLLVDLTELDKTIRTGNEINRVLEALCEVVHVHNCDILLLAGRPSKLSGLIRTVKSLLPAPLEKIVEMNGFRCGTWYPFNKLGYIDDPKTTAAVGAMLCTISEPNFIFRSDLLSMSSTARFVGKMTNDGLIPKEDVFYENVRLEDEDYELPEIAFEFRGTMRLGFRQLALARWRATMIYVLDFTDDQARQSYRDKTPLKVMLKRVRGGPRKGAAERFEIGDVLAHDGSPISKRNLKLRLQTLSDEAGYWLDSGHVKEA